MSAQPSISFADGRSIPQIGLGVWRTPNDVAVTVVKAALDAGYRHIDTASVYRNEEGVGIGLRSSDVPRTDIFLTTKIWNDDQGYDTALRACDRSLALLGTDYLDLCLVHWPSPWRGKFVDTWKALVRLKQEGRVRSIGVSNFEVEHLERVIDETGESPVINQIELHPRFQQQALRSANQRLGIVTQSWSPLGQGLLLTDPVIVGIARKHGRQAAQVIIRWHLQQGLVVIPKSVTPSRIVENIDVFDFSLDDEDMVKMHALDSHDGRIGPDPMTAKL